MSLAGLRRIQEGLRNLLTAPGDELGRWARLLRYQIQLWRHCGRRLRENNAAAMGAALSFRTIFALVPVLILAFLGLKLFGETTDTREMLWDVMDKSGLTQIRYTLAPEDPNVFNEDSSTPADANTPTDANAPSEEGAPASADPNASSEQAGTSGDDAPGGEDAGDKPKQVEGRLARTESVAGKVMGLVTDLEKQLTVGKLGPLGIGLLIWTALTLMTTIERSLNRIFEARHRRSWGKRILLYWSVLTLGPVALAGAAYASGRILSGVVAIPVLGQLILVMGWLGPIIVGTLLLSALYSLMPNTHVRFDSALKGAIVAVPLWLLARWAFELYVGNIAGQSVYGALILIPLFLLWLNLSWWIFLFGAELAHTAAHLSRMVWADRAGGSVLGIWQLLSALVAVAQVQRRRGGPADRDRLVRALHLPPGMVDRLLETLEDQGLICRTDSDDSREYLLTRSPEDIALDHVLSSGLTSGDTMEWDGASGSVARGVDLIRSHAAEGVEGMTLAEVVRAGDQEERKDTHDDDC
jgi:membrane protein